PTGQLDSVSFGVSVTPVNAAPAVSGALTFAADPFMPSPTIVDPANASPGTISISFLNMANPISGTVVLGQVRVPIPASAQIGQSYNVAITGANGSSAGTPVSLSAGQDSTILLTNTYLVGDPFPFLTDLNNDGHTYN